MPTVAKFRHIYSTYEEIMHQTGWENAAAFASPWDKVLKNPNDYMKEVFLFFKLSPALHPWNVSKHPEEYDFTIHPWAEC